MNNEQRLNFFKVTTSAVNSYNEATDSSDRQIYLVIQLQPCIYPPMYIARQSANKTSVLFHVQDFNIKKKTRQSLVSITVPRYVQCKTVHLYEERLGQVLHALENSKIKLNTKLKRLCTLFAASYICLRI